MQPHFAIGAIDDGNNEDMFPYLLSERETVELDFLAFLHHSHYWKVSLYHFDERGHETLIKSQETRKMKSYGHLFR